MAKPRLGLISVVRRALVLYGRNAGFFFVLSGLSQATLYIEKLGSSRADMGALSWVLMFGGYLLAFWGLGALVIAVSERYHNKPTTIEGSFTMAAEVFGRLASVSIFTGLIVVNGLLLFLVLGIYWATIFLLVGVVVVLENRKIFATMTRSRDLVKDYFGSVLVLAVFMLLTRGLFALSLRYNLHGFMAVNVLWLPLEVTLCVCLYYRLKDIKDAQVPGEDAVGAPAFVSTMSGTRQGVLTWLGIAGLGLSFVLVSSLWAGVSMRLLKDGKGQAIFGWVANHFSAPLVLPGGIELIKPPGYLVVRESQHPESYGLWGFHEKDLFNIRLDAIALPDLGIDDILTIDLSDGKLWERFKTYLIQRDWSREFTFGEMEEQGVETFTIGSKGWVRYRLRDEDYNTITSLREDVFLYTVHNNTFIMVSYSIGDELNETQRLELENVVQRLLVTMGFGRMKASQ